MLKLDASITQSKMKLFKKYFSEFLKHSLLQVSSFLQKMALKTFEHFFRIQKTKIISTAKIFGLFCYNSKHASISNNLKEISYHTKLIFKNLSTYTHFFRPESRDLFKQF